MGAADKLLAVFNLFTMEEPQWTVEAAAERLDLATSTTYRFFKSLSDVGLVSTFSPGRYVLGPAIVQLDRQARLLDPLIKVATPVMQRIVADLRLPGVLLLCRLFRKQVMCIHQEYVDRPESTVSYERGRLMPLFRGAASKVILMHMPARSVRSLYAANQAEMVAANFASDWAAVKSAIRRLRNARICITAGELDPGMTGLAAPLRDPAGNVDASLGFVMPDASRSRETVAAISAALSAAAYEIDERLAQSNAPPKDDRADQTPSYNQATPSKDCSADRPANI